MKGAFKIGLLLVLTLCEVRNSVSLPISNESSDVETGNLNDDVDFLLKSLAETIPSELRLDSLGNSTGEDCTLQGLKNGVKRQGDAAVTKVNGNEALLSFDFSMNETEVLCVPRKEEERSPAPVLLRPSWWTRFRNKVVNTGKKVIKKAIKVKVETALVAALLGKPKIQDLKVIDLEITEPNAPVPSRPEDDALLKKVVDAKEKISNELETALSGKLKSLPEML